MGRFVKFLTGWCHALGITRLAAPVLLLVPASAAAHEPAPTESQGEAPTAPAAPAPLPGGIAAEGVDLGNGWKGVFGVGFEERAAMVHTSAIGVGRPLPEDANQLDPQVAFENRWRVGAHSAFRHPTSFLREVRVDVQADLFSGPMEDTLEAELLRYDPLQPHAGGLGATRSQHLRRASLEVTTIAGRVLGGRTINSWGLGLLAQSAEDDPLQFGFRRTGHYVTRLGLSLLPAAWFMGDRARQDAPFVVSFAYDWIAHDDRADRRDGDSGNNIIASLGWFGKDLQVGFFGVRRLQENELGLETKAWVADVFARGAFAVGDWKLQVASEWVVLLGETEVARSYANPDHVDVQQFGGVVRIDAEWDWFVGRLEGGYASGDSRPYDDALHGFSFASDYRVGVALFPELLRRHTAVAAYNAQDPRFVGQPPVGFDDLPSRGAVTQAMYLHPVLGIRPFPNLTVLGGAVFARSPVDYADAYRTGLAGGTPTGPLGATRKRNLGVELNAGIRYVQPLGAGLSAEGRFDAGILFPGDVFDDASGRSAPAFAVTVGQLMLRGSW